MAITTDTVKTDVKAASQPATTPASVTTPPVATLVVSEPVKIEISPALIIKLASEIAGAEKETDSVTLGGKSLASKDQSNREDKRNGVVVTLIRNFKPNDDPKKGDIETLIAGDKYKDSDGNEKTVLASDKNKPLNELGERNKAVYDLLKAEYENPKLEYANPVTRDRVYNGILLQAGNLILRSFSASGGADKVFGLYLVKRIAKWDVKDQDILFSVLKEFESFAKFDREHVIKIANDTYDALAKMVGFAPVDKSTKTVSGNKPAVSLDDIAGMDLSKQVAKADKPSQGKSKEIKSNPTPTGTPMISPTSQALAAAQALPGITSTGEVIHHATPTVVSSTATKIDDPAQLAAIEAAKTPPAESAKVEESKPADKTPDPVVAEKKEDTPAETKKEESK